MSKKAEENKDTNIEQEAWDFVDLVFTGKYCTNQQYDNLVKLTKELKNSDIALEYLYNDIKEIISIAENKDNEELKKTLKICYESLNENFIIQDGIFHLFRMVKDIDIKFYYKIVFIFKSIYENKINTENFNRIDKLLNENKKVLCSHIEKAKKDKEEEDKKINDIENKTNKAKADILDIIKDKIYPEIITILGIFTAITFAIFGGMNLLSNLFQNMKSTHTSLGQALILAAVFNLCLWWIIELLFNWISKITNAKNKNINKYKLTALIILLCLFIFGLALFFKLPLFFN